MTGETRVSLYVRKTVRRVDILQKILRQDQHVEDSLISMTKYSHTRRRSQNKLETGMTRGMTFHHM